MITVKNDQKSSTHPQLPFHRSNLLLTRRGSSLSYACVACFKVPQHKGPTVRVAKKQTTSNKHRDSKLESVDRIMNLPVIESGWSYAGHIYDRLKQSNNIFHWAFGQAETSINYVVSTTLPAAGFLQGPISTLDKIVCQSLDNVEEMLPLINLPPEKIYWNTKQYVTDISSRIVHPILTRADSVKQIGNSMLDSKYTALAADTLDGALSVADRYVDKYLPADVSETDEKDALKAVDGPGRKAYHTIHHMDQFSRKLQRRLTRRTLAEARALKDHSSEAIHVLAYVVELIANDPKLALQKSLELWSNLSKDEPENQARPENLEELIVMLTRESARRLVHFVNFTSATINTLPDQLKYLTYKCVHKIDDLVKVTHLEDINRTVIGGARVRAHKLTLFLHQLNLYTTDFLEHVARSLEQHEQNIKNLPPTSKPLIQTPRDTLHPLISSSHLRTSHRYTNIVNGVDNVSI